MKKTGRLLGLVLATAALAGCGGGGGSSGGNPVPTPPPPPAAAIAIAGTAAKGTQLPGATVSVKCASGTPTPATATTAGTGAYSITLSGATLPCVLRVAGSGGEVFHSVVGGSGNSGSFTANLSPLTELLVARLAGVAPGTFFDGFGSGTAVSVVSLAQSLTYLKAALGSVTDLGVIDPLTDVLTVGNLHDQKIEAVTAALAQAGLTLPALADAIVANTAAPNVLSFALASAAPDCPWLKSGTYRVLGPYNGNAARRMGKARINATTLTGTDPEGQAFSLVGTGPCQYGIAGEVGWTSRFNVSSASLAAVHGQSTTTSERNFEFAMPEQTLPVAELAGTWSATSWNPSAPGGTRTFLPTVHEVTVAADGQVTALSDCVGLAACSAHTGPFSKLVPNVSDGGFDEILPGGSVWSRFFLYKTLGGSRVLVVLTPDGQFIVAAPKKPHAALPALGEVGSWREITLNGSGSIAALGEHSNTVIAVDPALRSVTRRRTADRRVDTTFFDRPRDGLRHRAANACSIDGAPVQCAEVVQLPFGGMTLTTSVGSSTAAAFLVVTVTKP